MKHKGSFFEYEEERNRDLLRAYHTLAADKSIPREVFFETLVEMPSSRYWVSPERAHFVIKAMMEGRQLRPMKPNKKRMFDDLLSAVLRRLADRPEYSLFDIVLQAVYSPAPSFYLTPESARVILCKIRTGWYERRRRKKR